MVALRGGAVSYERGTPIAVFAADAVKKDDAGRCVQQRAMVGLRAKFLVSGKCQLSSEKESGLSPVSPSR